MNRDSILKLCKMISGSFQVLISFYDTDGNIAIQPNKLNHGIMKHYINSTKHVVEQCREKKEIQISINEAAITWIGIPVNEGDLFLGNLIIGPFYSYEMSDKTLMDEIEKMDMSDAEKTLYMSERNSIPYYPYQEYVKMIRLSYLYLYDKEIDENSFCIIGKTLMQNNPSIYDEAMSGSTDVEEHGSYQYERYIWECIRMGDADKINELLYSNTKIKMGTLCVGNDLRNMKNLLIVGIALASRAAMDGGLNSEIAYSLADVFIRQIESMNRLSDYESSTKMFLEFAYRVKEVSKIRSYSPNVNQCCEYIKSHTTDNISVAQIADHLGISNTYLSRIFKQETGLSVVDYIKKVKIKEAKFLLKYTNLTLVEISEKLAYSSQSHFNTVFKEAMSITPKQYRDKVKVN